MIKINVTTVDELHAVLSELSILTYLQELVQYDTTEDILAKDEFEFVTECSANYLRHQQFKAIKTFKKIMENL